MRLQTLTRIFSRMSLFAGLAMLAGVAGGCANPTGPAWNDPPALYEIWTNAPEDVRIETLRQDLARTCPNGDPAEIEAVAGAAVRFGERVRHEYGLFRPVELNNILIQVGLKRRGLCFQLADDLFCRLRAMDLKTLDLHEGQAAVGDLIEEHNCVVVTDKGKPFQTGMLLDAWRYAGKLRWMSIEEDTQHEWKERPVQPPPEKLVEPDYEQPDLPKPEVATRKQQRLPIPSEVDEGRSYPCLPGGRSSERSGVASLGQMSTTDAP